MTDGVPVRPVGAPGDRRDAAENEGEALFIRRTKEAEADGSFIKIKAEAEKLAWKLRGQGLADFRREVATGIHDAVAELQTAGVDPNYLLFFMYTEAIKHVAENAKAGHRRLSCPSQDQPGLHLPRGGSRAGDQLRLVGPAGFGGLRFARNNR